MTIPVKTLDNENAVISVLIRIFSGSSMNRTGMVRSPSSAPLKQTIPVKLDPLQRSPQSRQQTATQGTLLNPKRISQHRGAAYLLWRRRHAGPRPSSLLKIHTTSIATLARYSQWHSSLSISSIGFIISFSEHFLSICCFVVLVHIHLHHWSELSCLRWLVGNPSLIWLWYIFSAI